MKCAIVGDAGQGPKAGRFLSNKENKLSQVADSFHHDPNLSAYAGIFVFI